MTLQRGPSYEVIAAGGGPAGICTASAAARTLLVETNGYDGGPMYDEPVRGTQA